MSTDFSARAILAKEHVARSRRIVKKQRDIIAHLKGRGADCQDAERSLELFAGCLAIFERDLADLTAAERRRVIAGSAAPGEC